MVDRPEDTLKRGERHSGEKVGKGSAESTKPYGEKKKSKSYEANRYSYPYAYRDPKASTSLQVLRKHRPEELQGISDFTAILYYFVGTFWCLLFSLLLWLHVNSDPIPVEKVIHKPILGEKRIVQQLRVHTYFEDKPQDKGKGGYTKYLLGDSAMHTLMTRTESNELYGDCVILNALQVNEKLITAGVYVQETNEEDYTKVSGSMNTLAPMCIERCDKTDGWIDEFEKEVQDPNGAKRNDGLDSVLINITDSEPYTIYYKNLTTGFDIGGLILDAHNCALGKLDHSDDEAVLRAICDCAGNVSSTAMHAFMGSWKDNGAPMYDVTHATVCVAGAIIKTTEDGPIGRNPFNIAVACSDNKRGNTFVLGVPLIVTHRVGDSPLTMSTILPSGGYSVLERTIRYVLIVIWLEAAKLTDLKDFPAIYYDPFANRTIVDDITTDSPELFGREVTRLSELPVEDRINHMSHLLEIYNSGEIDYGMQTFDNGCYYSCHNLFENNFTMVPGGEDQIS